jgi:multicomponent Na+:H+ antiporter subunit C
MTLLLVLLAGVMFACGTYLVLRRNLLKFAFGLILFGNAANLTILAAGRVTPGRPPLVPEGAYELAAPFGNPLPQALVLTAIVIAFGLIAFALVLIYRTHQVTGLVDADAMERDPASPEASGGPPLSHTP